MKQIKFKKTELLELNDAYKKIMYLFFSYPTKEVSLNDLTKLTKISKTTANRVVNQLASEGFLKISQIGNLWRITCNQNHIYNTSRKIAYNLELIYESGAIEEILKHFNNPRSIILFGSYRKGDDAETSDLDIAVEMLDDEATKIFEIGVIPQLGYRQNVKVNILKFTRNKIDLNLFANLANGIVLFGFLEARP
jgi:predicted nucleotidyltransferase